ncbi:glycoside hydrolase family protein [Synechococcus sp. CS-1332]|uniref:glycoside hydrolase family protein n=1 Tax=Synechococcus sp. CS-1332 TaxID=2847972 RepID=UPI00223BE9CF|nr:L,D-transpeptidase family protein [Synechococcus sp. CS-1332]MCT0207301.1 L,D-transpeptidase family protein [Synechococcus sp. CS-1332]
MPYITARQDAGLSPSPAAADADSYVAAGSRIAVAWVRSVPDTVLAIVRLAGPYTCPGGTRPLPDGEQRYLNPERFIVPDDAWLTAAGEGQLPPEVAELNHHYEGCRLQAYNDPRTGGEPITIGWGSTFYQDGSPIRLGDVITQEQADALYGHNCRERFWKVLEATIPFWAEMGDRQRAALCSFAYNNGAHFHGDGYHDTLDRHLRDRRWQAVPGALMLYRNPGETVEVGLGRRRRAEGLVWGGLEPTVACAQAEREIRTPGDCEAWEQRLKQEAAGPVASAARAMTAPAKDADPPALTLPGLVGPKKTPQDFGFSGTDSHVVVNDVSETARAFDAEGRLLWEIPALARGQGREDQYQDTSTDTPPGIYRIAKKVYRDYEQDPSPTYSADRRSYGWYSFDLEDLERQERRFGRAGIMVHGGGSACGWPGAWAPRQPLHSTLGCVRLHNQDLRDKLLPLVEQGTVYLSVYQEA